MISDPLLNKLERWQTKTTKKSFKHKIFVPETSTQAETETILDEIDEVKGITDFYAPFTQITSKIVRLKNLIKIIMRSIFSPEKSFATYSFTPADNCKSSAYKVL